MQKITKITQKEAKIAAKLYIASLFIMTDDFHTDNGRYDLKSLSSDEVNNKIQKEIINEITRVLKNIDYESLPVTSYDCIVEAKKITSAKKQKET